MSKASNVKPGADSQQRRVSRRLTSKQWDDVADLCNEAAVACETGYENHDWQARQKAAKWMLSLAMKAQGKAANRMQLPSNAPAHKQQKPALD